MPTMHIVKMKWVIKEKSTLVVWCYKMVSQISGGVMWRKVIVTAIKVAFIFLISSTYKTTI